jgi:hypothetical protein
LNTLTRPAPAAKRPVTVKHERRNYEPHVQSGLAFTPFASHRARLRRAAGRPSLASRVGAFLQTNNTAFERFINELDCVDDIEAGLSERTDRALIARRRICDDRTDVIVHENVVRPELPDNRRPEPATRHLDFSYREVDSCRHVVSAQLTGMLWEITPSIPLNPTDRNAAALYDVHMNCLVPINAWTILGLEAIQIEALIPPGRHMRSREPLLQQGEVRTPKLAE